MHIPKSILPLLFAAVPLASAQCPAEGYFPTACSVCVKSGKQPTSPPSDFSGTPDAYLTNIYINVVSGTQSSSGGLVKDDWDIPGQGGTRGTDCVCQGSVTTSTSGGCLGTRNQCRNAAEPSRFCLVTTERTNNQITVEEKEVSTEAPAGWTANPFAAGNDTSASPSPAASPSAGATPTNATDATQSPGATTTAAASNGTVVPTDSVSANITSAIATLTDSILTTSPAPGGIIPSIGTNIGNTNTRTTVATRAITTTAIATVPSSANQVNAKVGTFGGLVLAVLGVAVL
ncbi:hypothetical protein HK097_007396 [Rhizophlyctis rosea]|uniref:Uncharacterized protein n=1 Tax=Rhizophlyctis rosea TaxID=64517 RepID=A0AAD5X826_9FUNG|nr:hypothetical protein HK097_007396 [Rhizophlyctis rosea]